MTKVVRATLLVALALTAASCGGGGSDSSSPPPPPPPVGPPPPGPPPPPPPPPPPGPNAPPTFTSPAAVSVRENMVGVVYRPVATDTDAGDTLTYGTTIGGDDAARFVMNPVTREIRFATQPDYENPNDAGGNRVYDISFTVSDGVNATVTRNVAITVTNVANGFRVRRVTTATSAPIYAAGLPDGSGRVAIVERGGRIRLLNPSTGNFDATDFLTIPGGQIDQTGEKGLLSIAFSPNFVSDRTFYIQFHPTGGATEVRKYQTLAGNLAQADTSTADTIFSIPATSAGNHKGGTVAFDKSGRLLISTGDGGADSSTAQNNSSMHGKILRIDPSSDAFPADASKDYAIPTGNPFAGGGGNAEIYVKGLRNPFRTSVDPVTGDLFIGDVGQSAREEIDRVPASTTGLLNFGWDQREGSLQYNGADSASYTLPVTEYPRTGPGNFGTTVTGGVVYRGPIEDLQGQYIFGDYGSNALWSVPIASLNNNPPFPAASYTVRTTQFAPDTGTIEDVVAFGTDNDGNVYFVDIGGEVFILEPNP